MIDRQVDFYNTGKLWIALSASAFFLYIVYVLGKSISGGSLKLAAMLVAGFAAVFIANKIASDWRSGVYYFIAWLLFEDLIRKYMGNNMIVYFAKDLLLGITYASFVVSRMHERLKPFHPPFRFALGAFFLLALIQVFNPLSPSFFYGVLGLKIYFYYVPLMFVGYAMFQDESDLPRFFSFNMILGGIISIVGIIQSVYKMEFLNPMGGEDIDELSHMTRMTYSGEMVHRAPSVFVSEGRFGTYVFIAFLIGIAGAAYLLLRSKRGRKFVFPGLGLVVLGGIMTGSRGAVSYIGITAVLLSAAFVWGAPLGKVASYRLVKAIRQSFIYIALAVALLTILFPESVLPRFTLYQETLDPRSEHFEAAHRAWAYPLGGFEAALDDPAWFMGHGTGTFSLGTQYVARIMGVPRLSGGVENGFGALIQEFGIMGPILWIFWATSLLAAAVKVTLKLKGTWGFPIATSITWYAFILPFTLTWGGIAPYQNFVVNAYFWLLIGLLFRLPYLVKKSQEKPDTGASQANPLPEHLVPARHRETIMIPSN